ncbi:MAG: hypothetical protein RMY29_024960 [Nostoc sp. CreGUA01]|nr:hypothetical protein [Nostoc sp. CreGUA01]
MGRWGDGEMGRWGDGEMGRWGDYKKASHPCHTLCLANVQCPIPYSLPPYLPTSLPPHLPTPHSLFQVDK